ncbi:MAG: CDP-alcohol phosphatidyltransferase family protein [Rhodospirillales bacterium]
MLDRFLRPLIDRPLALAGNAIAATGMSANAVTMIGLSIGLLAVPALAAQRYDLALVAIIANRLSDGLDGAVARCQGVSDFGGYLDIVADMIFYGAVVFGFALAQPGNALWAALLLASFLGTSSSFLAYAALAAKRGLSTEAQGKKSFFYSAGLIEGSETVIFLVLICLVPQHFALLAQIFAALCGIAVLGRIAAAYASFKN